MNVVAHNLLAMNVSRQYNIMSKNKAKSSEKLSSGYRINRSADDAAGLQISEKMRSQIRGLDRGATNVQDGISFLQVADGAINEISDMLIRMKELSIQAANGTYLDEDRAAIQDECDSLVKEIDKITTTTEFNGINVFGKGNIQNTSWGNSIGNNVNSINNEKKINDILGKNNVSQSDRINSPIKFTINNWTTLPNNGFETGWQCTGDYIYRVGGNGSRVTLSNIIELCNSFDLQKPKTENDFLSYMFGVSGGGWSIELVNQDPQYAPNESNRINIIGENDVTSHSDPAKYGTGDMDGHAVFNRIKINVGIWVEEKIPHFNEISYSENFTLDETSPGAKGYLYRDYGSSWLDFSGLGQDYSIDDLDGKGFGFKAGGDDTSYNIVLKKNAGSNTTTNGSTYSISKEKNVIYIGIDNCTDGEDIAKVIYDVMNESGYLKKSHVQCAYNKYEPSKIYFFDNRPDLSSGSGSEFFLSPRLEEPNRYSYDLGDIWIQAGPQAMNGFFIKRPALDIYELNLESLSVKSEKSSAMAMETLDNAITVTNRERTLVGAQHNKCEYAYNVDNIMAENTQYAESRIRDTDMAEEMVEYSKNNILEQVGQSVLAQANQSNQGVLSLLS